MEYLFLKEDYDKLCEQARELRARIMEQYETVAESTRQSAETFHDNYEFEDGQRQIALMGKQLESLVAMLNAAKIVTERSPDRVGIGSRVTVEDAATGAEQAYLIGSYLCASGTAGAISYTSPVAKALMGAVVGESREVPAGSVRKILRVVRIE